MDRKHYARLNEIFQEALQQPAGARAPFLEEACEGDEMLREQLLELFAELETSHDLLSRQGPGVAMRCRAEEAWDEPEQSVEAEMPVAIGPYRVRRCLGEGGMGVVYEAEQERPRRRVAVKVLRPGFVSQALLGRFHREGELLGRLQHPGIARIFEAGHARPWGAEGPEVPYLVMELVDGEPITAHAASQGLDTAQRLELLARVCEAVEHAHEKGIVHRDLKPANVLVDGKGQPRVLDFGVARALDSDLTQHTATSQLVGTLPYMSPEQLAESPADLGPRSDVYSLGVLAYELLADRHPLVMAGLPLAEAIRQVEEVDPPRLGLVDSAYRGDVEAIVGKALEKEAGRRYDSAAALAADLRRHLANEPILASPQSAVRRARKFIRRNRALSIAMTALVLALTIGTALSSWLAHRAAGARTDALDAADASERSRYRADLAVALEALHRGNARKARSHLEQAPERLREWTWRQAFARLDDSLDSLQLEFDDVRRLVAGPGGRLVVANLAQVAVLETEGGMRVTRRFGAERVWLDYEGRRVAFLRDGEIFLLSLQEDAAGEISLGAGDEARPSRGGRWFVIDGLTARLHSADGTLLGDFGPYSRRVSWQTSRVLPGLDWVAVGSDADGLDVTNLRSGRTIHLDVSVRGLAATPDGRFLIVAGAERLRRFEVGAFDERPWPRPIVMRDGGPPRTLKVDPLGERILTISRAGDVELWRLEDGSRVNTVAHAAHRAAVAWYSPDGERLVIPNPSGWLQVFSARDGQQRHEARVGHDHPPRGLAWVGDGTRVVGVDAGGMLRLFVAPGEEDFHQLSGHASYVYDVDFSEDGQRLLTTAWDGSAQIWEVGTGRRLERFDAETVVGYASVFLPGRDELVSSRRNELVRWEQGTGRMLEHLVQDRSYESLAVDRRAGRWLAMGELGRCRLVSTQALAVEVLGLEQGTQELGRVALSPDGERLFCASGTRISAHAIPDGTLLWERSDLPANVNRVAVAPHGRTLAIAAGRGATVLDAATGELRCEFMAEGDRLHAVALHPELDLLATGSDDGNVRTWDLERCELIAEIPGHRDYVHDLAFSPDGEVLASASGDATVRLWHTRSVRERLARDQRAEEPSRR